MNHKMTSKKALNIATVRGIGFSLMVAAFLIIGQPLRSYMWCSYVGFTLCVAVGGISVKRLPNALCSCAIGFFWAAVYMGAPGLINGMIGGNVDVYIVLVELVTTFCILYTHLYLLQNTPFNMVPFLFGSVACTFGKGSLSDIPLCFVAIAIGILTAFITGIVIDKTAPKEQ